MAIDVSRMTLPELFEHVSTLPAAQRSDALKAICALKPAMKQVIQLTFDSRYEFVLPKGAPPYKPMEMPDRWGYNRLPKELNKIHYFLKGSPSNLTQAKREKIFIDMLESVSAEEAKLLIMIKDKKLDYKGITKKVLTEAFPELFVGEKESKNV